MILILLYTNCIIIIRNISKIYGGVKNDTLWKFNIFNYGIIHNVNDIRTLLCFLSSAKKRITYICIS